MRMNTPSAGWSPISWPRGLAISALATAALMGLMFWARAAFQIRTLPERIMEWLLLFVPLDAFEKALAQFGPKAKDLALYGGIAAMCLVMLALGAVALRRLRSGWAFLGLGLALWLFAMAVVMPVTGAGFFAAALFQNVYLVNASYLGVALAYVSALLLGKLIAERRHAPSSPTLPLSHSPTLQSARRSLLWSLAGLVGSYVGVAWFARQGTTSTSTLPLAQLKPPAATPSPATAPRPAAAASPVAPAAASAAVASPATAPTAPAKAAPGQMAAVPAPPPTPAPKPTAPPTPDALPVPPPARELVRDKDGSLTASGRKPGELSPLITDNGSFYIVTKNAGGDPVLKPDAWRLLIDGEVNAPVQLDYRTLRQLPAVEQVKTLECISNFTAQCELTSFGCDLIGTATWKGVRLKDLFELAGGVKSSAVALAVISTDEFSSALPIEAALDPDTILAYEMNGEVLPYEHGYPARLLVPGRYGMKNAKWVMALRPMIRQFADFYGQRNWNREGVVKTMARIDQPAPGAELAPGGQQIAGIAYAGDRGVKLVEFSADGGQTWQPARFVEPPVGRDAWVRWQGSFNLSPGAIARLVVRATDGAGELQTETFSLPQPDGGSGRHSVEVRARA